VDNLVPDRFYNPGGLGDIIYAIPFCLSCIGILDSSHLDCGMKFEYYLDLCLAHRDRGEDEALKSLRMVADVLSLQPYIKGLHVAKSVDWNGARALDLGIIRKGRVSMENGDITRRYRFLRRLPDYYDASQPWLVVGGAEDPKYDWLEGKIAVFRTTRYRNRDIYGYTALRPYADRLVFFGTSEEHDSFVRSMRCEVPLFKGTFVDACRAFQRCAFVVGNQTFFFSLAEALKVPRLCEMSSEIPDVMPLGRLANAFVDSRDFIECLKMYARELKIQKNGSY